MKKKKKLIKNPHNVYLHLLYNSLIGFTLIFMALFMGVLGYHVLGKLPWVDSFLNAAMILSGMGPVDTLKDSSAKIFSGCYALFSGLAFISIVVLMLSPIVHKFIRKIHLEASNKK